MGTRAELDSLARELAYIKSKYSACQKECDELYVASENMKELYGNFNLYITEIANKIDSYNKDNNKWVGILFDEIEKTNEYVYTCFEKFDAVNTTLQTYYQNKLYYKDEILAREVSELERKVRNFKIDDEEGGLFSWL